MANRKERLQIQRFLSDLLLLDRWRSPQYPYVWYNLFQDLEFTKFERFTT